MTYKTHFVSSAGYLRGLELFNQEEFFDAHEVLEDVWRPSVEPDRRFLQGLIQVAVAFHHHSKGNLVGAGSLLKRGALKLAQYEEPFGGIALTALMQSLEKWQKALAEGTAVPPLPKI